MRTYVTDTQVVTGDSATLFDFVQQGPHLALVTLHNTGSATMNYTFQEQVGATWTNLASQATLQGNEVKRAVVESNYPRVRLIGHGDPAGGSSLAFSVTRTYVRPSGGTIPLIAI